jgi:predicted phage tail protein
MKKHFYNFNNFLIESLITEADEQEIIKKIQEIDDDISDFDPTHDFSPVAKLKKVMNDDKETINRLQKNIKDSVDDIKEARKDAQLKTLEASDLEEGYAVDSAILSGDPGKVLAALNKYSAYRKKALAEYKKLGINPYEN